MPYFLLAINETLEKFEAKLPETTVCEIASVQFRAF
jgi:hypothetical protein